ncbi:MAG TPA: hypothetical protein VD965_07590 [Burkholderiales bacterium]|nr:hypothetical protein [Burkholderiales bacterium]
MRIVTRAELMAMPAGTLYHEWEPCYFKDLCIKGETTRFTKLDGTEGGDWWVHNVPTLDVRHSGEDCDVQFAMAEKGVSHPLNFEVEGREALFDDKLRYAVWERADVEAFVARLTAALQSTAASQEGRKP